MKKRIKYFIQKILKRYYYFKYRKQDQNICCCGNREDQHKFENHVFTSEVDYVVNTKIKILINKIEKLFTVRGG